MIIYAIANSVTDRPNNDFSTLAWSAKLESGIDKVDVETKGVNHVYVAGKGFYRILFFLGGAAYLAAPTVYSNGTKVKQASTGTVQTIKLTNTLTLE
jgi:hypothetical protein